MSEEQIDLGVLDPNYPLMVMLREKCPGTFAHSKNVASMLEAVGSELGLDVKKLKIAGYFHDIGKTISSNYFSENQGEDDNPHDKLDPWMSHKIITSHVAESCQILINDKNVCREIIEWIVQHHGTTVVRYFYEKSGSKNSDQYRYKCSKPTCVESMLLMLCDHLEARTRALELNSKLSTDLSDYVEKVFNEMFDDEQFDEVSLPKLGDLRRIKQLISRELSSQFHKRVDYGESDS
jgi:putative nucleotidyltransferase with HDIG domain